MAFVNDKKRKRNNNGHPYLTGNFAPITHNLPLTPCSYTGTVPQELVGGQYVRNGGNPVTNEDLGRDAHWFDGDGMLCGVAFTRCNEDAGGVRPEFVNQHVLTDIYLSTISTPALKTPILPSIATLVNPLSKLYAIILRIFRTILLVILSHLPGSQQAIRKISVANTSVIYHDGRALATCESGPPMRVSLPGLETVGWYNGRKAEGETIGEQGVGFGGQGLLSFMKEWTTAHPRVDPTSSELILFHSTFAPPYVHYSIIPSTWNRTPATPLELPTRLLNVRVPGVSSAKMMHDFGVSKRYTVILDLPLSLDPLNLAKNQPVVAYDPTGRSRFGIFPRYNPEDVRWFETSACCIFHTANTWDNMKINSNTGEEEVESVNLLACRLTSASLVFSAGNIAAPVPVRSTLEVEEDQCRLYYYQFAMSPSSSEAEAQNSIVNQWALSAISFEFPSLRQDKSMTAAKYIYGCSVSNSSFGAALGRAVKIDCLVKVDVETLIKRGKRHPPTPVTGCVDERNVDNILLSTDPTDPIKVFKLPSGWYAQESRFVARTDGVSEDDGWILSYVFDESQLDVNGDCFPDATSELWIIEARNMKDIVGRIYLPQRVPYGLHGNWFSEDDVLGQRPVDSIRKVSDLQSRKTRDQGHASLMWNIWMDTRKYLEAWLG